MALSAVKTATLADSHRQLKRITHQSYNDKIRDIALAKWEKDLSVDNPQWQFLEIKSFTIHEEEDSAHVLAMVDSRLPNKGLVGYFACTNSVTGARVLKQAISWLKTKKAMVDIYGPINGTLPNDYRLNTKDDYIFPGEPVNPVWHIDAFKKAGFKVFNNYVSGKLRFFTIWKKLNLKKKPSDISTFTVRAFSQIDYENDFHIYHDLRNQIFPFQSVYCAVISLAERKYNSPGKFDPDYTYFLLKDAQTIGFIMAYLHQDTLIIKTIGILPEFRGKGLSALLLDPVYDHASRHNIHTVIFGMVRVGNSVYNRRNPFAKIFRRYVTMHISL
jgi:GNAT superfamily N-acetyltransferase